MPIPVLLDVDTGLDDALAILYAVAHPDLEVLGISCVAGNAGVDQVVTNTAKVLDAAGAPDIPYAAGAARPLVQRVRPAGSAFHGSDGLGGIALPEPARQPSPLTAVELLRQQILASAEPVTLVGLAPQTNLALLLTQHPEVLDGLDRVLFMGGSASGGNVTAAAEYNVWQDPEAASCVVESAIATTMYGLDVFTRLTVPEAAATRWRQADHRALRLAGELLVRRGHRAAGEGQDYVGLVGDAGALVLLTDPDLFTVRSHPVRVELAGLGRGQTIVDRRPVARHPDPHDQDPWSTLQVALDLDAGAAATRFTAALDRYAR